MRYNYYVTDSKVICVSSYAGKAVRGISKCDPKDTFNVEKGKDLAQTRCDFKISEKRLKRANQRYNEACDLVDEALAYKARMANYQDESLAEYQTLKKKLADLEASM